MRTLDLHLLAPAVGSPLGEPGFDPVTWALVLILCLAVVLLILDNS
jgi:hypothetical protein